MSISQPFIERPVATTLLTIALSLAGGIAYFQLPVVQYPEIAPPTIVVRTSYPGADSQTIADTVATTVADSFYGHLFQSDANTLTSDSCLCPDTTQAARALHFAVAALRSSTKCPLAHWVPFIHFGL